MMLYIGVGIAVVVAFYAYLVRTAKADPYELRDELGVEHEHPAVPEIPAAADIPSALGSDDVATAKVHAIPGYGVRGQA